MKIFVSVKMVPDVSAPMQIKNGELIMDADRAVLNAYDASGVEEALVLKEAHGGEVIVVSVGPAKAAETLRKALAMGADSAVHITTEGLDGVESLDSYSYARILAAYYADQEYDALFFGKQSQDTDAGLTGGMVAELLGVPYVSNAVGITREADGCFLVKRQGDSGQEMVDAGTGCLITCSNDMNEPRIPKLKGIMASKKKPLEVVTLSDLGVNAADVQPKTQITAYGEIPARQAGQKFSEGAAEDAGRVAELLEQNDLLS
jgi:electron transfer flavoprotein beta subunit